MNRLEVGQKLGAVMAASPYRPTQSGVNAGLVNWYADLMVRGEWDWARAEGAEMILIDEFRRISVPTAAREEWSLVRALADPNVD